MKAIHLLTVFFALLLTACSQQPDPIHYGHDQCEFCKMTIMDKNYGAELLSKKGKAFKFDSPECMIEYMQKEAIPTAENSRILVTSYGSGAALTDAELAIYLKSPSLHSPMGANITAFTSRSAANKYVHTEADVIINWEQVKSEVLK